MDNNKINQGTAKHFPFRAIALDLDGTLTNHDKVVTPRTRQALLQAESKVPSSSSPLVALPTALYQWQNASNWKSEGDISSPTTVVTS